MISLFETGQLMFQILQLKRLHQFHLGKVFIYNRQSGTDTIRSIFHLNVEMTKTEPIPDRCRTAVTSRDTIVPVVLIKSSLYTMDGMYLGRFYQVVTLNIPPLKMRDSASVSGLLFKYKPKSNSSFFPICFLKLVSKYLDDALSNSTCLYAFRLSNEYDKNTSVKITNFKKSSLDLGLYSPTILKNILGLFFQNLQIRMQHNFWLAKPNGLAGLANHKLCYVQMLLNIENWRKRQRTF